MPGIPIEEINKRKPTRSRLTAMYEIAPKIRKTQYPVRQIVCICECGNERIKTPYEIISGDGLSCGCIFIDDFIPKNKKYNIAHPKLKSVYYSMKDRCYNPKNKGYKTYGKRGVRVCDEWKNNPQSFFDWAAKGYKPGLQLDKDIIGTGLLYSPETCCWITHKLNQSKTTRSHKVEYKGKIMNICELERISGIADETLRHRIANLGLTPEQAVNWQKHRRIKTRPKITYDEFKKKWVGVKLSEYESAGMVTLQEKITLDVHNIGVIVCDIFTLPSYWGWAGETQRHYFHHQAKIVNVRPIPKTKNKWYIISQP